jgi:hypothetical protein
MNERNLSELFAGDELDDYDLTSTKVFLEDCTYLGVVRHIELVQGRNTMHLIFSSNVLNLFSGNPFTINTVTSPILDPLLSSYRIYDAVITSFFAGSVYLDDMCRERIVNIRVGILERLRIIQPLVNRLNNPPEVLEAVEPIDKSKLSTDSQSGISDCFLRLSEAKLSMNHAEAAIALESIAEIYQKESEEIKRNDIGLSKRLSNMSFSTKLFADAVKQQRLSIFNAESMSKCLY